MANIDPVLVEIVNNALMGIAMEMKATMVRTAFSSTIQEAQDFSVGLFEKERMIAQADTMAGHAASYPPRVRAMLDRFPLDELNQGDIIILNDPYCGGTHTPDVATIKVVRLGDFVFFPVVFGHWSDVGGATPGSISGRSTDLFQEGLVMPPIKLAQGDKIDQALWDLILRNVRLPQLRAGDLRAQIATCNVGEARIKALWERYGTTVLRDCIEEILNITERRMRARIEAIPDGVYEYEDYLDSDGQDPEPIPIHLKVTVKNDSIKFDFTGTAKQSAGPSNVGRAAVLSAVASCLKILLEPIQYHNEGLLRPIEIQVPEGSCLKPLPPAPTGSTWEVVQRVRDVIMGALADITPRKAGVPNGSVNHTFIGGVHPKTGRPYVWYEYPAGALGGTSRQDGAGSMVNIGAGDTRDMPVERVEAEYPLLCTRYAERIDSGGPGKFRGGVGLIREVKVLDDMRYRKIGLSSIWDRSKVPSYGIFGGFSGCLQRLAVRRASGETDFAPVELGSKVSLWPLNFNDTVSMRTGGGGGYGDPLERPPERVLQDLRDELISETAAREVYGVVINREKHAVDAEATGTQREEIRRSRIYCAVRLMPEEFTGRRRAARLSPRTLGLLGVTADTMLEIVGKAAAPLRVWAIPDEKYSDLEIGLDETAQRMLKINVGDKVWTRDPLIYIRPTLERESRKATR